MARCDQRSCAFWSAYHREGIFRDENNVKDAFKDMREHCTHFGTFCWSAGFISTVSTVDQRPNCKVISRAQIPRDRGAKKFWTTM